MAYVFTDDDKKSHVNLSYLPLSVNINSNSYILDRIKPEEYEIARSLLNYEIESGRSWPTEFIMDEAAFQAYFLTYDAFIVKNNNNDVVGTFYIKPNFPGRCSHICNGGFIVHPDHRRKGIGRFMGKQFLRIAKDIGYKAAMFNLCFVTNVASVALWDSLGFERLAVLKEAGRLKGEDTLIDAVMFRKEL